MPFNRDDFDAFLIANGCIEFYSPPIGLKCGRLSWWNANLRKLYRSILLKRRLAAFVYDFATDHSLQPDFFLGVPLGAIPLGESVNDLIDYKPESHIPATILRSEYKTYGDSEYRYAVGPLEAGKHVVLIDDTVVTGNSFMRHIPRLQDVGIVVDGVVVCVYRMERRSNGRPVDKILKDAYGVDFFYLTAARSLLPTAVSVLKPNRQTVENIENYYKRYGIGELKLSMK